jgi:hypothetical protein
MAAGHLLREVLEGGAASRGELLRRVERFTGVAVLRPDGYPAWTRSGRTQQLVAPVQWRDGALRAGPFELGRFYSGRGEAFRCLRHSARLHQHSTTRAAEEEIRQRPLAVPRPRRHRLPRGDLALTNFVRP